VPAPSPGAAGAVAAAMSQLGVGYRYATAIPGVAFDCSGLTAWAWGQAGVALPHQSRQQFASLPHVGQGDVQPGDLLFFYNPIGHVAMYIGNGQMVHATHPGDVVRVAGVGWDRVVGIGRP
jgi:cell wall-associated NlpC family hydrolase